MAGGDDEDDRESSRWQTAAKTIARSSPLPAIDSSRDRLVRTLYCMHIAYYSVSVQLPFRFRAVVVQARALQACNFRANGTARNRMCNVFMTGTVHVQ